MKIEIFGPGCAKCRKATEEIGKVVARLGVEVSIEHVTAIDSIVDRGVMLTPAVFIDGEKKIEGKVPKAAAIERWLQR